ncbi:MAG: tetratricopeptide repeat protein [Hyphomicrobiaceae bacterium]
MADQRDELIREVDEELRRERLQKLWDQYGIYAIGVAVLFVASIAGYKVWESRAIAAAEQAGQRYEAAARLAAQGKPADALEAFSALAKDAPAGYEALARLRAAGAASKAGKTSETVVMYEALAADTGIDPLFRDFAKLQAAALKIETADWTEMQNRLNDLVRDGNPWRYSARELLGLAAYKAGKSKEAREALEPLAADRRVPAAIAGRVRILMDLVVAAERSAGREPAKSDNGQAAKKD